MPRPIRRCYHRRPETIRGCLLGAARNGVAKVAGNVAGAEKPAIACLLLKTNMGSGHFGSSGRYEYLKETAFNYAFLLNALASNAKHSWNPQQPPTRFN